MLSRPSRSSIVRRRAEDGFSAFKALVGVAVLAVLAGILVVANRGNDTAGQKPVELVDAKAVQAAEEAFCAKNGMYGTMDELVTAKFLSQASTVTAVAPMPGGSCIASGQLDKSGYMLGFLAPNGGSPASWDSLQLAAGTDNGYPTPFQSIRGPGGTNTNYLFDPLLWRDATGQAIPWLATAWQRAADGLSWTFTLRSGVKWQDDVPFTADDVVFTFDYYKNATGVTAAQVNQVKNRNAFVRDFVTSVTKVPGSSPEQVVFNLKSPVNTFMTSLAQSLLILPQHVWSTIDSPMTAAPGNAKAFVGTGAYILQNPTSYDPTTGVSEYVANPHFFLGEPYVKRLRFVTVGDALSALLAGPGAGGVSAGGIGSEESVPPAAFEAVQKANFAYVQNPGGWNRAIHFNELKGFPYNSVAFRQAFAYTIDREALLKNIVGGRGELSNLGGLAPSHPFVNKSLPTYARDVAKAKSLLDSIGLVDTNGDGKRECPAANPCTMVNVDNSVSTSVTPANFAPVLYTSDRFSNDTVEAVQAYLRDIGIDSTYVVEPSNTADARGSLANYGINFAGYGNLTAEADQLRTRFASTTGPSASASFNAIWGWTPAKVGSRTGKDFAALAAAQLVEPNEQARINELYDMQEIIAAEVPIISLYSPYSTIFYPQGGFAAWYATPGGTPPGPPGFTNKHVFITGKQFGLPGCAAGGQNC